MGPGTQGPFSGKTPNKMNREPKLPQQSVTLKWFLMSRTYGSCTGSMHIKHSDLHWHWVFRNLRVPGLRHTIECSSSRGVQVPHPQENRKQTHHSYSGSASIQDLIDLIDTTISGTMSRLPVQPPPWTDPRFEPTPHPTRLSWFRWSGASTDR